MRDRKGVHGDEREGGEKLGGEEEILFIFHCMIKKSMFNKGEVCSCAFSLSSFDVKDVWTTEAIRPKSELQFQMTYVSIL